MSLSELSRTFGGMYCTEGEIKVCTWLREIYSFSCFTALPGPAWVLLSKTNKPLFPPLYMKKTPGKWQIVHVELESPCLEVCKKICQICLPLGHPLFSRISVSNFNLNSFSASLRDRNLVQQTYIEILTRFMRPVVLALYCQCSWYFGLSWTI